MQSHHAPAEPIVIDTSLVRKYDKPGPRYTSYPTADRFIEAYGMRAHQTTLHQRGVTWGPATNMQPLSLYVHVPFCNTICFYCGCNKVVTKDHGRSAKYLRYLDREFGLVAGILEGNRRAEQVHLGGGTPTFLHTKAHAIEAQLAKGGNFFIVHGARIDLDGVFAGHQFEVLTQLAHQRT